MGLASLIGVDGGSLGSRFSLVSLLPTSVGATVIVFVLASGAPGQPADWDRAVRTARGLDAADVGLLAVGVLVVAAALHPLQLSLVRLLEGYWGNRSVATRLQRPLLARQARLRKRLADRAALPADADSVDAEAAAADQKRRARFPRDPLLPTGLGNALRAAEQRAGSRYAMDAVVLWPRLYPLVPDQQRAVLDDRRDQLDLAARLTATLGVTAAVTAGLLWRTWTWWWLPVALLTLSALSYRAAVAAAVAYGDSLRVTFDLYRFDLLTALHLPLPADNDDERKQNTALSTWLRQGGQPPGYHHPD